MRVTSKGQVTIPQQIRERLGIQPGTEVEFEIQGDAIKVTKASSSRRGRQVVDRLRASGHGRMTTDEILALMRE